MRVSSRKLLYAPRKLLRKHPLMIIQLPATSIVDLCGGILEGGGASYMLMFIYSYVNIYIYVF